MSTYMNNSDKHRIFGEYIALTNDDTQLIEEAKKASLENVINFLKETGALRIIVKRRTDQDMWPTDYPVATVAWRLDIDKLMTNESIVSNDAASTSPTS